MRFLTLLILLTCVPLLINCGGGGAEDRASAPGGTELPDERGLAESLLLDVSDFPSGWAEGPTAVDDEDSPFEECTPDPAGRTGRAETGDFSRGGSASISQQVSVFLSNREVADALDRVETNADCSIRLINDGALDDDEVAYSNASLARLSFPAFGNRTEAYRLTLHAEARNETGLGSEGEVYFDVISVIVGRVGFTVQAVDAFTPFQISELEEIVSVATAKVEAAAVE